MSATSARVAGVVLAAGRSTRMGSPKALLRVGDETFLSRAVRVLRDSGCEPVVAVVPPLDEVPEAASEAAASGARVVTNPDRGSDPIDSIRLALRVLDEVDAAAILPVDHPRLSPSTVRALIETYSEARMPIVRPSCGGRAGHPVVIDRSLWGALAGSPLPGGLRGVVNEHLDRVEHVVVADPGIRIDVDTPEAYAREVEGR